MSTLRSLRANLINHCGLPPCGLGTHAVRRVQWRSRRRRARHAAGSPQSGATLSASATAAQALPYGGKQRDGAAGCAPKSSPSTACRARPRARACACSPLHAARSSRACAALLAIPNRAAPAQQAWRVARHQTLGLLHAHNCLWLGRRARRHGQAAMGRNERVQAPEAVCAAEVTSKRVEFHEVGHPAAFATAHSTCANHNHAYKMPSMFLACAKSGRAAKSARAADVSRACVSRNDAACFRAGATQRTRAAPKHVSAVYSLIACSRVQCTC